MREREGRPSWSSLSSERWSEKGKVSDGGEIVQKGRLETGDSPNWGSGPLSKTPNKRPAEITGEKNWVARAPFHKLQGSSRSTRHDLPQGRE